MATLEELEDKFLNQEKNGNWEDIGQLIFTRWKRNILLLPISLILLR